MTHKIYWKKQVHGWRHRDLSKWLVHTVFAFHEHVLLSCLFNITLDCFLSDLYNAFPALSDLYNAFPALLDLYNAFPALSDVYNAFPALSDVYNASPALSDVYNAFQAVADSCIGVELLTKQNKTPT